ncbi:hypothetical protein GGI23_003791 [Coemansia sp. RSA 2559]|nr:hypothetical protein GGI23_003791 [Coemansia sp. RSA 2559]
MAITLKSIGFAEADELWVVVCDELLLGISDLADEKLAGEDEEMVSSELVLVTGLVDVRM